MLKDIWNDINVIDSIRYENGRLEFEIDNVDFETFVCLDYVRVLKSSKIPHIIMLLE